MAGQSLFDSLSKNTRKPTKEGKGKMTANTRKFRLALTTLMLVALLLSVFGAVPAWAQTTWYVDDDTCPNVGYGSAGNPFCSIQDAIDAATAGDTINVAAGTYSENVVIDRTLSLIAGSSPVINAGGTSTTPNVIGIAIAANDVTVDGFTVINARGNNSGGIYVGGTFVGETRGLRGVTVKNCTVHDSNFGIYPWGTGSGNANVVDHNTVFDIYDDMSGGGGIGIVLWDEGAGAVGNSDNEVTNNTVYNCDRQGIFLGSGDDVPNDNNEISGNIVHDNGLNTAWDGHGIQLYYAAANTISNNEIYNHTAAAWFQAGVMLNYSNDNAISGNNIYDNKLGVALYTNTGVNTIHFNNITGNTDKGVGNWDYAILVDATCNWWGDISGPYCPYGNLDGKGDEVSYAVDYDPWLLGPAPDGPCANDIYIDIKPGSDPNSINPKSKGVIPVAILSTSGWDAPNQVDTESLTFGPTGDEDSLHRRGRAGVPNCGEEDVNGDGYLDLVCHFNTQPAGFECGDTEGILKGYTVDGVPIEGSDSVRIVPCK
jgi:nitrous oxidase accessory protein NosD